ncbi:MAG: EF-P lysine aminoacylase GenX [Candidatus Lambdaproteobacteria bacterium]|nr:EF-P lysine aminoacylase GenX [Candidatus Lambdaproteobacteria bacterium]
MSRLSASDATSGRQPLRPGVRHLGRVVALPHERGLLHVYVGERLLALVPSSGGGLGAVLAALREGDLVALQVDAAGALSHLARIGGPREPQHWLETGDALRWRRARGGLTRMARLRWRQRILREVRIWFDAQDFLEVDTPARVPAPSPEPQFRPIAAGGGYLITSPEFQLKRLLVGGCERIYRLGPAFRGAESGAHHNPEFTMLEWYRAAAQSDVGVEVLARDLEGLLGHLAPLAQEVAAELPDEAARAGLLARADELVRRHMARATLAELFRAHLGLDIAGVTTIEGLRAAARAGGWPGAETLPGAFDDAFFTLWERIETRLPTAPLLVSAWPAPLASLARLDPRDPRVAERLELYAGGLELANGFVELTDPVEQRRRFEADLAGRAARGMPPLPLDERFLSALDEGMPPATGMALGVERLVMLLTGAADIRDVLAFAHDEL